MANDGDTMEEKIELARALSTAISEEVEGLVPGYARQDLSEIDGDPLVVLKPKSPRAAPLEISVDSPNLITCFPGVHGMTYEVFSKRPDEILTEVRNLARAVRQGKYQERVNDMGRTTKIVASWPASSVTRQARLNVVGSPSADATDWDTVTYDSYDL